MDFGDDSDLELITQAVAAVCAGFDDDYWSACDTEHRFPWEFYERMAEGGWIGIAIPEEYGGGGRGITEAATILRTVAASGAAMNGCSAIHLTIFGLNPVVVFGNDQLKDTFLPRAAAGDLHVAFGVTEPDAGTDSCAMSRCQPSPRAIMSALSSSSSLMASRRPRRRVSTWRGSVKTLSQFAALS